MCFRRLSGGGCNLAWHTSKKSEVVIRPLLKAYHLWQRDCCWLNCSILITVSLSMTRLLPSFTQSSWSCSHVSCSAEVLLRVVKMVGHFERAGMKVSEYPSISESTAGFFSHLLGPSKNILYLPGDSFTGEAPPTAGSFLSFLHQAVSSSS